MRYTCVGDVRGSCRIKHRTILAAVRCIRADHLDCQSQGGYSDRAVFRVDGRRLSSDEMDELDYCEETQ